MQILIGGFELLIGTLCFQAVSMIDRLLEIGVDNSPLGPLLFLSNAQSSQAEFQVEVTQMNGSSWKALGTVGAIIAAIVALHGITTRRWQTAHTVALVLSMAAAAGPALKSGR